MLSGLLITVDIFVCIGLVVVVLLQRSEGGGLGMGGGPTGLITARGAADLLTRTTWVLFTLFIVLSLGLSLLGSHERATSSLLEKLKLQQANPNVLSQPLPQPGPATTPTGPAPSETPSTETLPGAATAPSEAAPNEQPGAAEAKPHRAHEETTAPSVSLEETTPAPPPIVAPGPKADETPPATPPPATTPAPLTQP
jgi:preprotein translocase subunit SecG